jgi:hypothetical protein
MSKCAFYCVSGRDYFPGAAALVNSLRLLGHTEPVHLLDCGLDPAQRELLGREANIVETSGEAAPSVRKLAAPLHHPAEVRVILDADLIVTRRLDELIASAREGRLVAFENERDRHFDEWGPALGLGALRRAPYLMSSAVAIGGDAVDRVLPAAADALPKLDLERTWLGAGDESDPFFYADQDVLNAVAAARLQRDEVVVLPARLAAIPPFEGLRLADLRSLRCEYRDGVTPYLLHHYFRKPWLARLRSNIYSRLLTRLLLADDVAVRVPPEMLPLRLRTGARAAAARLAVDLGVGVPAGALRRLGGRPRRIRAWPDKPAGA